MPKAPPKKKTAVKARAAAKPAKKAAPAKAAHSAKAVAKPKHENFMMKILKKKEAALKQAEAAGVHAHDHKQEGFHSHARGPAFAKFAGHRRRNAS